MSIGGFWYYLVGILAICFAIAAFCAKVPYPTRRKVIYRVLGLEGVKEGYVVDETELLLKIRDREPSGYREDYGKGGARRYRPVYPQAWYEKSKLEVIRGWK